MVLDKKSRSVLSIGLISLILIIAALIFVIATHVITISTGGTSYSVNEDVVFVYNITVNNTDSLATANISRVNITIPNTFTFLAQSNGTDAGTHTFTNTSTVLTWDNAPGLVMNLTWKYFWFNATASTPGSYNLIITTTNATASYSSNISVTINDTTFPLLSIVYPTNTSYGVNVTQLNYTIYDANLNSCWFSPNNGTTNSTITCGNNVTNMNSSEGTNIWRIWANDSSNNVNVSTITFFKDTIYPKIAYNSSTESDGVNKSQNWTYVGVTVTEANPVNMTFYLYNTTTLVSASNFTMAVQTANNSINFTGLPNELYTYYAKINDTAGNVNITANRTIRLDTTAPIINISAPASGTIEPGAMSFNYTVSDNVNVSNCTLTINGAANTDYRININQTSSQTFPETLTPGTYSWSVNCSDYANNQNYSTSYSFTVAAATTTTTGGSSTSGTTYYIYSITSAQVADGYTQALDSSSRIRFQLDAGGEYHYFNVTSVGTLTASIVVSSTPQTATMTIGDVKKFELTGDGYYDLSATLNNITGTKANFTIKSIHELIPVNNCGNSVVDTGENCSSCAADVTCAADEQCTAGACVKKSLISDITKGEEGKIKLWVWIVLGIVVILLIIWIISALKPGKNKYGFK